MIVKTRRYGRTGMFVPELSLGTANFGGQGHAPGNFGLTPEIACGQIAVAMDHGVNLFDTADGYTRGNSESAIGEAIKTLGLARRDFIISTKVGIATGPGANQRGASRVHILEAITASLRRLSVDYVDIYHVHLPDRITPIEETVRALQDVVARGYARHVACSNWLSWRVMKAIAIASQHGWPSFDGVESYYSLAGRDIERELVPLVVEEGLGLLAYSPQARGLLSGKADLEKPSAIPVERDRVNACLRGMRVVAAAHGVSLSVVAIAWLLTKPFVSSVIIGASSKAQLLDNLSAGDLVLGADEIAALDRASALRPEYPGWLEDFAEKQRFPRRDRETVQ